MEGEDEGSSGVQMELGMFVGSEMQELIELSRENIRRMVCEENKQHQREAVLSSCD